MIIYNPDKENVKKIISELYKRLSKKNYIVSTCSSKDVNIRKCKSDLILTLGGDGTILRAGQYAVELSIPIIGINLGGLGYLAEFRYKDVYSVIDDYFNGVILPQERKVLLVNYKNKSYYVINDCVIKSVSPKVISLDLYINNKFVTNIVSDGIIIATPTGSTAYSLACNGSIVEPEAEVILVTPISPHSLTHRPIILNEDKNIKIFIPKYKSNKDMILTLDGQKKFFVKEKDWIELKITEKKLLFIPNNKKDFFTILRQKLNWGKR